MCPAPPDSDDPAPAPGSIDETAGSLPEDDAPIMDRRVSADRRAKRRRSASAPVDEERRTEGDRRKNERRQSRPRPRSINQYDMEPEVLEFVNAVNRFREQSGNRFPSAKDILGILRDLGYEKQS